jgi:hypothetical protein
MSDDRSFEIEVKARDAAGQESVVHAEYTSKAANPQEAARQLFDAVLAQRGRAQVREIDPSR